MIVATFLGNILFLAEINLNSFGWQMKKKKKKNREIDVENVDKQKKYWYRKCQEDFW